MREQQKNNIVNKMKTPGHKLTLNPWYPLNFQVEQKALNIEEKRVRSRLPTITQKVDNK